MKIFQVDAFTNSLFKGNPAAVVPLDSWIADDRMLAIAAENNLSETAFFVKRGRGYELRWFTPSYEVNLCGHATLATSFVIFNKVDPAASELSFETKSGTLTVKRIGERLSMDFPSRASEPTACPDELRETLGVQPVEARKGVSFVIVLRSEDEVRSVKPDMNVVLSLATHGLFVTAPGKGCDFVARCFFPDVGIPEDPVTGSAYCTLVPYWSKRLGKKDLFARQVSQRGGEIWCKDLGPRVEVAGECVLFFEGEIAL